MKQKELSRWIKAIAVIGAVCVAFFAAVVVPRMGLELVDTLGPDYEYLFLPCLIFICVTVVPVLAVAVLAWLIATDIGRDNSFCAENAARLRLCCILAVADTALYLLFAAALAVAGALHPGMFLLIFCVVAVGAACAVVFAALSHLTRKASDMKSENDLTI